MNRIDWLLLALIVLAFWIFDVLFIKVVDSQSHNDFLVVTCFAICIGQVNLIGAWGALAPGKVVVRIPWAGFLGVLMWHAITIGQNIQGGFAEVERLGIGISIGFGVVATQVPLWIARWPFRWRLLPPRFPLENVEETDAQFNLKHLFLGMFFASVALGLAKFTLSDIELRSFSDLGIEIYVILPVVAVCNALVTLPCIWMAYASDSRLFVWAMAWMLYALLVSVGELIVLTITLGPPGGSENMVLVFTALNLAQCLTVFSTMLMLRLMGFRLIRANQLAKEQPSDDDDPSFV